MAFWKENSVTPKRKFRFQVQFGSTDSSASDAAASTIYWWAKTIKVPSYTVESVEHHYLDNRYNFPGRVTWEDCEMSLVDPSSPDAVDGIMQLLALSGYKVKAETDAAETIGKIAASKKMDCIISLLDEAGTLIEKWTLNNCFIVGANLGDYDYASDDLREMSLTLKYDWATCEIITGGTTSATFNPQSGVSGTTIGRTIS